MAANLSDFAENKLVDHLLGEAAYTMPTVRVALFTADPTETGSMTNEVPTSGTTNYARQAWSGTAASSGASSNDAEIAFPVNGGTTYTATHIGLVDAAGHQAGNVLVSGPLAASRTIANGEQLRFQVGEIDFSLT